MLTACEEKIDYFDMNFENKTTHTKEELLSQLHHFAELTTNQIPGLTLDESYYPKYIEGYLGEPVIEGEIFTRSDLEYNNRYSQKNLWINALNEYTWNLEEIYELLEVCDFEEATLCEYNTGYDIRELKLVMEDNQLLIELRVTSLTPDLERNEIIIFYLADIENELYLEVERYQHDLKDFNRKIHYTYYENHYSKEYYAQDLGEADRVGVSISVVDLSNEINYTIRFEDITDEIYSYGFYNYENDTHYFSYRDTSESLEIYENDKMIFKYSDYNEIITYYDLTIVDNWDYIEYTNQNFELYKDDMLVAGIDVKVNNNRGELIRKYSNTPNNGQVSLNDIGLDYDITMDRINTLIEENENHALDLFESLNIQSTYDDNKALLDDQFTFTYTLDQILNFLNEKIDQ
jgi:hypothetical protein